MAKSRQQRTSLVPYPHAGMFGSWVRLVQRRAPSQTIGRGRSYPSRACNLCRQSAARTADASRASRRDWGGARVHARVMRGAREYGCKFAATVIASERERLLSCMWKTAFRSRFDVAAQFEECSLGQGAAGARPRFLLGKLRNQRGLSLLDLWQRVDAMP